jgi:tRNA uridine 5-carboxymethylaminomethyl modification enzyme
MWQETYDIIVVGGGHAGCEAALAAGQMGMKTVLITMDIDRIGQMSCNPSIGGIGKGHMVREIDALGGAMGKAIDATGIHFKMLGLSRGPAIYGPRAQADRKAYQKFMLQLLENAPNVSLRQERIEKLLVKDDKIEGVAGLCGITYLAKAVILTTGTFLNGLIHVGLNHYPGGRAAEPGCIGISRDLAELGLEIKRLKTGTPPRLHGKSIDYTVCAAQQPDAVPRPFSFRNKKIERPTAICYLTHTNPETHRIIRESLDRSPLYTGIIKGTGVRYCPSLEDKVVRFADKEQHQVFLEPEGLDTCEVYPNGISTSLPADVQLRYVHSIRGLEKAEIVRFGYGIEYDFVPPTQIYSTLETKRISGLYLAGQINGTTGYEEAAAQGLLAAVNAVRKLRGEATVILRRADAYLGVLIDDLVTRGTTEPYRMFTSRAEHRILLRQDNADRRLTPLAYEVGLVSRAVYEELLDKEAKIKELTTLLWQTRNDNQPLAKILRRPEVAWQELCKVDSRLLPWNAYPEVVEQVEIEIKYEGYLRRQEQEIKKCEKMENLRLPGDLDYHTVPQLRREAKEKLTRHRPLSIGQAARIEGIAPADISLLLVYLAQSQYRQEFILPEGKTDEAAAEIPPDNPFSGEE